MSQKIHIVIQLVAMAFLLYGTKKIPAKNIIYIPKKILLSGRDEKYLLFKTKSFTFAKTPFSFYLPSESDPLVFFFVSFYFTFVIVLLKCNTHKSNKTSKYSSITYHNVNTQITLSSSKCTHHTDFLTIYFILSVFGLFINGIIQYVFFVSMYYLLVTQLFGIPSSPVSM